MNFLCGICNKTVTSASIHCDSCKFWVHIKCSNLSNSYFQTLSSQNDDWYCSKCYQYIFPFQDIDNDELLKTFSGTNETYNDLYIKCKELNKLKTFEGNLLDENWI